MDEIWEGPRMKAAVLKGPRDLRVENVPRPTPEPDEVLVRVRACGICGSDIRYYMGHNPWALHTLGREEPNPPNIILGHEFAGEVCEVGADASSELIGKRVVVAPYKSCGMCPLCRTGNYHLCKDTTHLGHGAGWGEREYYPGGMAELCAVWADKAYVLPDHISFEEAALLDIAGVGIHALGVSGMAPGASIAIVGVGPLGATLVQTARVWGAKTIFCSDVCQKRVDLAASTGADQAFNPEKDDFLAGVLKKTNDVGVDVVIDTVCLPETQQEALQMLALRGTLVNMAIGSREVSFNLLQIGGERAIRSSCNYFFHDLQMALDLAAAGRLRLKPLITHQFALDEANQAFDTATDKERYECLKVVVLP